MVLWLPNLVLHVHHAQYCTSTGRGGYISIVWRDTFEICIVSHSQVEEAMSAFAVSTRTGAPTDINDIDLARPVTTLAETISKAMSALYALHVAMGRSCAETSSNLMEFVECKQRIRAHWGALESFLQHSLGYARDYLALCQSLQHESQAQYAVAAFAILAHAQQIRSEIARFKPAYAGMVKEFEDKEPTAKFRRGNGKHGNSSSFDGRVSSRVMLRVVTQFQYRFYRSSRHRKQPCTQKPVIRSRSPPRPSPIHSSPSLTSTPFGIDTPTTSKNCRDLKRV
ncbi:hypothetical protein BDN71DRAFT_617822 [Pleurotus eryngii]|uniref:Uncharacterized protein n=1 Tax=Pleurotus eryngii TaxID=5323 RepID=A0A9P5ZKR8_PLEER|nr:hypothetical protein BDN71DRAFT_617822 [Pleurotus eryngii]